MEIRKITDDLSVSPQFAPADVAAIKAAGFRAIICNRPDGEGADQPDFDAIEAAAKVEGLEETLGRIGVTLHYRYDLAPHTWQLVQGQKRGRALFSQPLMSIECAGAPQEALYLSADHWNRTGVLKDIDLHFCNAGGVLFGVKDHLPALQSHIERYGAHLDFFHNLVAVDGPPQMAPDFIRVSPLSDMAGWVDVDQATLRHKTHDNIRSLGDVLNAPTPRRWLWRASWRRWWPRTSWPTSLGARPWRNMTATPPPR